MLKQFLKLKKMKKTLTLIACIALLCNISCDNDDTVVAPIASPENVANLQASEGDRKIELTWTVPDNAVGYKLTYSPDGLDPIFLRREITSYEIIPLTNDQEYTFTLSAAAGEREPFVYSEGATINGTPVAPPKLASFSENFEDSCPGLPEGWVNFSEASNKDWGCVGTAMEINGYGGDTPSKDWLITPAFELSEVNIAELSFDYFAKWSDLDGFGLDILISSDYSGLGDPTTSTWTSLEADIDNAMNTKIYSNATLSLSAYSGKSLYIAFYYETSGTGGGSTLNVGLDNVSLKEPKLIANFDDTCPDLPDFWINHSENSNKDWSCVGDFNGGFAFEMNSYGGDEPSKDWLITPALDLPADNDIKLTFDYFSKWADAVGFGLDAMISTDYTGSGDPTSATWTSLNADINNALNNNTVYASSSASLSAYSGEAYVAFFYSSSGTGGGQGVQMRVDNIKIK